jgi:hypothetical protein
MITAGGRWSGDGYNNVTADDECDSKTIKATEFDSRTFGHLAVWDLEKQILIGQMTNAHRASVHTLLCLHGNISVSV